MTNLNSSVFRLVVGIMLVNADKKVLFLLVNKSIESRMPKIWKEAKIIILNSVRKKISDPV